MQEDAPRLDATAAKRDPRFLEEPNGVNVLTSRLAPSFEPCCGLPAGSEPFSGFLSEASQQLLAPSQLSSELTEYLAS